MSSLGSWRDTPPSNPPRFSTVNVATIQYRTSKFIPFNSVAAIVNINTSNTNRTNSVEKLTFAQLLIKFRNISWNLKAHYRADKSPPLLSLLNQAHPVHKPI